MMMKGVLFMTQINFRIEEDIKRKMQKKALKRYGTHYVFGNNNVSC